MQLFPGREIAVPPSDALPPRMLTAGIAVAVVGAIAAGPVTHATAALQHRGVQLTDSWSTLFGDVEANLDNLRSELTDHPFPILTQLGANLHDYAQLVIGMDDVPLNLVDVDAGADSHVKTITSGFAGFAQGVQEMINGSDSAPGITELLQNLSTGLQDGDPLQAFSDLDTWLLFGLEGLLKPLVPVITIPEAMLQNFTSVLTDLLGPESLWDFGKAVSKAFTEPLIGVGFEFSQILGEASSSGDPLTALAEAPAQLLDALLNGYHVPDTDNTFIGLLSPGGTLESLLETWPQRIADALTVGTADLQGLAPAESLGDLLGGL